jgi:protein-S-isoprenylcysteine O-methyltransferase Ste14
MKRLARFTTVLVLGLLVLLSLAVWLSVRWDSDSPLSIAVIGAGLLSFVFFLWTGPPAKEHPGFSEEALRMAIAGAIVIEYIVLVGIVAFFQKGPDRLPPITQTLVSSFTTIVGVVVAFYFGSSAYVQARNQKSTK